MPNQAVEALLFDLGGVVIEIDFDRAFRRLVEHSRLPLAELRAGFRVDAAYEQHERGELEAKDYIAHLRRVLELDCDDEAMIGAWNSIFVREISETVDAVLAVREQLPCYALTNSNPTHQAVWTQRYPRAIAAFRDVFVSSDLGHRKPEREAFHAVAERTGTKPESMLFFDDTLENVEGARRAGLQAVHVTAPEDVTRALMRVGGVESR